MSNKQTNSITDLRVELLEVFDGLRQGRIEAKDAVEVNNTAGKIISTVKLQLAHAALCGTKPVIPFLNVDEQVTLTVSSRALAEAARGAA